MYKISQLSVEDYLEKMAICDFPGPAAGSAAATSAAMAAALLEMSCDGSLRKNPENQLLKESIVIGTHARQACLNLADADMEAYGQVIQAAKIKEINPQGYEMAMKQATEPFIGILDSCHTILRQIEIVIASSFSSVLGDLVGGVYLAEAAAAAAKSGIEVNLALISDSAFREKHLSEARTCYQTCFDLKAEILKQIFGEKV